MAHPIPIGAPSRLCLFALLSLAMAGGCGGGQGQRSDGQVDASSGGDRPIADIASDLASDPLANDQTPLPDGFVALDAPSDSGATPPPPGVDGAADAPLETAAGCQACAGWGPVEPGRIDLFGLYNLSGMAASWRNPGILFVHNDRDRPRFYAVDETGTAMRGDFSLAGATVVDLEDMAVSRCPAPAGTCVYLADIGNNISPRTVFAIYRLPEPEIPPAADRPILTLSAERFEFSYADRPHNAESLVVDPDGGAVYVITKEAAGVRSAVYRLQTFETGRINQAVKVVDLPVPASNDQPATAASAQPCGAGFLLRTGNRLYEFRTPAGSPFAAAFNATPVPVPSGQEQQSEAVTYGANGRSYYTTGEGVSPALFRTRCLP